MTVNAADDDEYFQLTDFNTIIAYQYWKSYGLTADQSQSYTDLYTTSGSLTYSASVVMSASSSSGGSASTSGVFQIESESSAVPYSVWIPKSVDLSLTPDSGQTGSQTIPQFSCVYNPSATGASATMTCTAAGNSVFTQDDYTLEINTIGNAGDGTGGLFCYLRPSATQQSVGTITALGDAPIHSNFTLSTSTNETGSFTGSGTISMTTSTTNVNRLDYVYPLMNGTIDNSYPAAHNRLAMDSIYRSKTFYNNSSDPFMVIFLGNNQYYSNNGFLNSVQLFSAEETTFNHQYTPDNLYGESFRPWNISGYLLYCYNLSVESAPQYPNYKALLYAKWNFINFHGVIPLYVGYKSGLPDTLYRYLYHSDRTIEQIDAQTQEMEREHDEKMDTTPINGLANDGDALIDDADEKFSDLFFPLNHAIETANDLANVDATGVIKLPAIFSDNEYWYLDLTQIEQKIPAAWHFIQALCQLAVAIYMIHGLYNLFFGGSNDS